MSAGELHVVFRVAEADYVLPTEEIVLMESYLGATPVPGAAPWVAGLVQVRGQVVPVVDLRVRFGLAAAPLTQDSRIVVVRRGDRTVGLLVDSARRVMRVARDRRAPVPEGVAGAAGGFVDGVVADGDCLLMSIDLDPILAEESRHGD